ncbi:DUF2971 domain-containing protein [Pseudomonas koreensis]|uniref:DUF2971 domain-containing protein n=1 Tax=Pseudomonas koreensis TaxID=198620 RepID=UPI0018E6BB79|nr:DUF2971 domain-containing protein [Pseudomonas koreensis]MBI6947597.1 DUF2971 domain-containing protein [Pseudomonas koreensis]
MLYKYLPPERIDVIQNLAIRFTQLLSLNDPFEHSLMIGSHEYALDEVASSDEVKFVSLSRNHTNLLMWSHYAASHKGFCVGFKKRDPYFISALSVRYRRYRSSFNGVNYSAGMANAITKHIALEKAIDWAYEEEERLFLDNVHSKPFEIGSDPWGRRITLNPYPAQSIALIYIGLRADESLIRELITALRKHNLNIDIFKANRNWNEFGITFKSIDQEIY